MNHLLKNTVKCAIGTCFTMGAVVVAASVVVGSNVGKIVSVGFKGAKNAVAEELAKRKIEPSSKEESSIIADTEETMNEEMDTLPADFEN